MKKKFHLKAIKAFKPMREPLTLQEAIVESNRCLLCEDAPCTKGCPAGTDPGKFIRQIKFQNYKGAARTIRRNNIMGSVCAHVCPTEKLCEAHCSAKEMGDPINISGLQQFAINYGKQNHLEPLKTSEKNRGKVAVIGAGPAGLSCAAELAHANYDVTIYEKESSGGGVPRWNIPDFRLPPDIIDHDLTHLAELGVTIKYHHPIDTPQKGEILLQNYDAVFVGTGLNQPFLLPEMEGFSNAKGYIDFLRSIKTDRESIKKKVLNRSVIVIGGGSVALDSAISAKALGASKVYVISLEHLSELPADPEEIELAHGVHIIFKPNTRITGVKSINQQIVAVKGNEISWREANNYTPSNAVDIQDTEFILKADYVVQAIGTKPLIHSIFPQLNVAGKGCIVGEDGISQQGKLFAAGDVVTGGATVVRAVGDGKKIAMAIDRFIKGGK